MPDFLTIDYTRSDAFDRECLGSQDWAFPIDGLAQGTDNASQKPLTYRDLHDASRPLDRITFSYLGIIAEKHAPDVIRFEIKRHTHDIIRKGHQFAGLRVRKTVDPGDTVAYLDHCTCFINIDITRRLQNLLL